MNCIEEGRVHRRIFSGERFCTFPPSFVYICGDCGHQGEFKFAPDFGHAEPEKDLKGYVLAVEKFHGISDWSKSLRKFAMQRGVRF